MKRKNKQGIFALIRTLVGLVVTVLIVMSVTKVDMSSYLADRDINWLIVVLSIAFSSPYWVGYSRANEINQKYGRNRVNSQYFLFRAINWLGIAGIWAVKLLPEKYPIILAVLAAVLIFAFVMMFYENKILNK